MYYKAYQILRAVNPHIPAWRILQIIKNWESAYGKLLVVKIGDIAWMELKFTDGTEISVMHQRKD